MAVVIGRLNNFVEYFSRRNDHHRLDELHAYHAALRRMPTEELQRLAVIALEGRSLTVQLPQPSWLSRVAHSFSGLFAEETIKSTTLKQIALACAIFERFPADIPPGSALFPQQMQAGMALTQRSLVQMNTGEGKTYAILPAGFAQCCRYNRVYILCPNAYLAQRDAERTQPFWTALGLKAEVALEHGGDWSARVIYTTLRAVMFHHLSNEIAARPAQSPITFGAAVLDEADAILLDEANLPYQCSMSIPSSVYDWELALQVADLLTIDEDISVNRIDMASSLTLEGERKIAEATDVSTLPVATQLVFRVAVENAFIARSIARENVHYIREGDALHVIDVTTGSIRRGYNPLWIAALKAHLGLPPTDSLIPLHSIQPRVLLQYFDCISGLSGTIKSDSTEYLAAYQLPTLVLPPLKPRHNGETRGVEIYATRNESITRAVVLVREAIDAGRPVLVGTGSFADAQDMYGRLVTAGLQAEVNVVSETRPIEELSQIIEKAGAPGSVLIGAHMVGRGLDIRLTDEAKAAGGLFLVGLGIPPTDRIERQFLGRAGRQGDRWDRVIIGDLEQYEIFPNAAAIKAMLEQLGLKPGEVIEDKRIDSALKTSRETRALASFMARRRLEPIEANTRELRARIRIWFEHVQAFSVALEAKTEDPAAFLGWLTETWATKNLDESIESISRPSHTVAAQIVAQIAGLYEASGLACTLNPLVLVGKSSRDIRTAICDHVRQDLVHAVVAAQQSTVEAKDVVLRAQATSNELPGRISRLFKATKEALSSATSSSPNAIARVGSALEWDVFRAHFEGIDIDDLSTRLSTLQEEARLTREDPACEEAHRHKLGAIGTELDEVVKIVAELRGIVEQMPALSRRVERSPLEIANWTLQLGWCGFLDREAQLRHQTKQEQLSEFEEPQILRSRLFNEWQEFEKDISRGIVTHLLAARAPDRLDDLFSIRDSSGVSARSFSETSAAIETPDEAELTRQATAEVEQFLGGSRGGRLRSGTSQDKSILLQQFLKFSPLHKLHSPTQISEALTGWADLEERLRVPQRFRAKHKEWISSFLVELNTRGRIGPVPLAAQPGLFSRVLQLRLRDIDFSWLMVWSSLALVLASFPLLSLISMTDWATDAGMPRLIEKLMLGPLLEWGAFTAPAAAGIGSASIAAAILYPNRRPGYVGSVKLEQWIVTGAAALVALLIVSRAGSSDVWSILTLLLFTVLSIPYARLIAQCIWTIENLKGINLVYAGVTATTASLLWSDIFEKSITSAPAIVTLIVAIGIIALRLMNTAVIPVIGVNITNVHLDARQVETFMRVRPNLTIKAHCFSFILALATKGLAAAALPLLSPGGEAGDYLVKAPGVAMYVLSLCLFAHRSISIQFSMRQWDIRLNRSRLFIKDHDSAELRRAFLGKVRRRMIVRECSVYMVLGLVAVAGLAGSASISLETALIAFSVSALMAEAGFQLAQQIAAASRSGPGFGGHTIEMRPSQVAETATDTTGKRLAWLTRIMEEPWIIVTTLAGLASIIHYTILYWPRIRPWFAAVFQ